MRLLAGLVIFALPLLDIFVTRAFATATGTPLWIWLVIGAVIGVLVLRHERAHFKARFMQALVTASSNASNPWRTVLDSGRKLLAGVLLLLPGLMTDMLALALIVMPLNVAARLVPAWASSTIRNDGPLGSAPLRSNGRSTVDGQYRRVD